MRLDTETHITSVIYLRRRRECPRRNIEEQRQNREYKKTYQEQQDPIQADNIYLDMRYPTSDSLWSGGGETVYLLSGI